MTRTEILEKLPARLKEIVEDFQWAEGQEKLELLLEYSDNMPPLPESYRESHDMQFVHECMTPVYVQGEMVDGGLRFYFDVPPESPTVRGFAAILGKGLDGSTPEEVISVPDLFYLEMGLADVLTHQRLNGFSGILANIKRIAYRYLN